MVLHINLQSSDDVKIICAIHDVIRGFQHAVNFVGAAVRASPGEDSHQLRHADPRVPSCPLYVLCTSSFACQNAFSSESCHNRMLFIFVEFQSLMRDSL